MIPRIQIIQGDCLTELAKIPSESVHCCVTSPPYWGLRDYGVAGQICLEKSPEEYVAKMVAVFREVKRVLRDDGILFLNLGDSYWGGGNYRGINSENTLSEKQHSNRGSRGISQELGALGKTTQWGLKPKDLVGIPWRVAFALQADGWYLRSDIIWAKANPMPESVTDRPTKAHEYIFLLTKAEKYFYDAEAVKDACLERETFFKSTERLKQCRNDAGGFNGETCTTRNKRSVWTVPSAPYRGAHFATFPPDLIKPCILAGTSARGCCPKCGAPWERIVEVDYVKNRPSAGNDLRSRNQDRATTARGHGGWQGNNLLRESQTIDWKPSCQCAAPDEATTIPCTVLDPFGGSGTTGQVALELGRNAILIELNPEYINLAQKRTHVTPGLPLA